jgi:hypothetical protein
LIGNRVIADIQKELAVKTGEAPARFFPRLKREALVTIIAASGWFYVIDAAVAGYRSQSGGTDGGDGGDA